MSNEMRLNDIVDDVGDARNQFGATTITGRGAEIKAARMVLEGIEKEAKDSVNRLVVPLTPELLELVESDYVLPRAMKLGSVSVKNWLSSMIFQNISQLGIEQGIASGGQYVSIDHLGGFFARHGGRELIEWGDACYPAHPLYPMGRESDNRLTRLQEPILLNQPFEEETNIMLLRVPTWESMERVEHDSVGLYLEDGRFRLPTIAAPLRGDVAVSENRPIVYFSAINGPRVAGNSRYRELIVLTPPELVHR